jgi:Holliday junction resolvase
MTPEARVKNAVKKLLTEHGVWYFMPVSNGMGRHGIPDVICCVNGHFLAIECKAGKGVATALQQREMERIGAAGGDAMVVSDDPETMEYLQWRLNQLLNPA